MATTRVLLVDDETPARRKLRRLLEGEADFAVVGEAGDGPAAIREIREHRPDVVFLDIRMPGLDGFEVVRRIGVDEMPTVVFVTAYNDRALEAFEVQALDYLLKPVSPTRFAALLDRLRDRVGVPRSSDLAERLEALLQQGSAPAPYLQRIMVWQGERAVLVPVERVDRIEAARNYVLIHVAGGAHQVRHPIGELAEKLDPARFLRLNRSNIVRLDAIKEMHSWFHGDMKVVLHDGTELMWSRRYRCRQRPGHTLE